MRKVSSQPRHVTLSNVASLAGVSTTTASRVFDPKWANRIRPSTRERVTQAAEKLGYYGTNALAQALQGSQTNIIALVNGIFTGYHYLEVNSMFIRALQAAGKQVLVFEVNPTTDLNAICAQVHRYCVDAIIITAPATSKQIMEAFPDINIPVLLFGRTVKDSNISVVRCDEYAGAQKAAALLLRNGYKTFGVISGNRNISTATDRIDGFCDQIRKMGGEILYMIDGDYTYESGMACMRELLRSCQPDAVYCAEDSIAMGAMDVARNEFSLRVPDDIAFMGFDNVSVSHFQAYNLSSMAYPLTEMIASAVDAVEKLVSRPQLQIERIFNMEPVLRGSVRLSHMSPDTLCAGDSVTSVPE